MTHNTVSNPEDNPTDFYAPLGKALPIAEQLQGLVLLRARTAILQMLKAKGARTVLDVCCGSGCLSCRLSMSGFEVTGVDSSPTMLNRARIKRRGVHFLHCDASRMPFSAEFDAAVVSLALHEMDVPLRESVWEAMRNAVKPGGLLIALDFMVPKRSAWYTQTVARLIDKDEKQIGGFHSAHYENFKQFMNAGGLEGWLNGREQHNMTAGYYAGGNLGVFAVTA